MKDSPHDYHISFFKPTTPKAKANRNMILWMVSLWFVAIFGFQFLLRFLEKPTPETSFISFQSAWSIIEEGTPQTVDFQELGKSALAVLGKSSVVSSDKPALNNALNYSIYQLTTDSSKTELIAKIQGFESIKNNIENISDPAYKEAKMNLSKEMAQVLGLSSFDARSIVLPLELNSVNMESLSDETKAKLPAVMEKYLVHNQSFLTDFKFLGFPFHYFYTAVFLLIMFVGLCWIYCVQTDKQNAKLNVVE